MTATESLKFVLTPKIIVLFQIIELLPRTLSGKNVRKPLKGIAEDPSMKGKQEVAVSEIQKHCGPNFHGVFMCVSDYNIIFHVQS